MNSPTDKPTDEEIDRCDTPLARALDRIGVQSRIGEPEFWFCVTEVRMDECQALFQYIKSLEEKAAKWDELQSNFRQLLNVEQRMRETTIEKSLCKIEDIVPVVRCEYEEVREKVYGVISGPVKEDDK